MMTWQWYRLNELSVGQLYKLFALRSAVFVVEQNSVYQDLDGHDLDADHLIGWAGEDIAACLRVLQPGVTYEEMSIGRVVVAPAFRGCGAGREILKRAMAHIDERHPRHAIRISAQAHLQKLYGQFGFNTVSGTYLEDGIPHVKMLRQSAAI
jgi:ElaA protein